MSGVSNKKDESLVNKLRQSRDTAHEALAKLMILRSRHGHDLILVVEGGDDVAFYQTITRRLRPEFAIKPLLANGKDLVLSLLDLVRSNKSGDLDNVKFAVDKDFDGLKGRISGADLYCTPTYSVENLLATEKCLREILSAEFRCALDVTGEQEEAIVALYNIRLTEFFDAIKDVNTLIFYARKNGKRLKYLNDNSKKYVSISLSRVESLYDLEGIAAQLGLDEVPSKEELAIVRKEFESLSPLSDWRGKFLYDFFRTMLQQLKEDRGKAEPIHFEKRAAVSFEPSKDMTRHLASIADIPECLQSFVRSM